MGAITRRPVLVVEDAPDVTKALSAVFSRVWPVISVTTVADALTRIAELRLPSGAIVDARLPDGSGTDVLLALRDRWPSLPLLAFTGHVDERRFMEVAQELGAEFGLKASDALTHFARRIAIADHVKDRRLGRHVDAFAREYDLTIRLTELVALACLGYSYRQIADRLGTSLNTVRTHVQELAQRCPAFTLGEAAYAIRAAQRDETRRPAHAEP